MLLRTNTLLWRVLDVEKGLRRGEPRLVHAEQHDAEQPGSRTEGGDGGRHGPHGPHDEGRHAAGKKAEARPVIGRLGLFLPFAADKDAHDDAGERPDAPKDAEKAPPAKGRVHIAAHHGAHSQAQINAGHGEAEDAPPQVGRGTGDHHGQRAGIDRGRPHALQEAQADDGLDAGAKNSGRDGGREQQHAAQADALAAPLVAGPAHDEMKNGQSQAVNGPHKTELGAAGMQFPPYGRQHHGNAGVHERSQELPRDDGDDDAMQRSAFFTGHVVIGWRHRLSFGMICLRRQALLETGTGCDPKKIPGEAAFPRGPVMVRRCSGRQRRFRTSPCGGPLRSGRSPA